MQTVISEGMCLLVITMSVLSILGSFRAQEMTERRDDVKELTTGWTEPCSEDKDKSPALPAEPLGHSHNNLLSSLNMSSLLG